MCSESTSMESAREVVRVSSWRHDRVRNGSVASFGPSGLAYACRRWFSGGQQVSIEFKGGHFERGVILWGIRWYVAYPISYRQLEEMMEERGVEVDHSTLNRWVLKYAPLLEKEFRAHKRPVGRSWRMDETYVKVKGSGSTCIKASTRPVPRWTSC
jgi:hypothetical protein